MELADSGAASAGGNGDIGGAADLLGDQGGGAGGGAAGAGDGGAAAEAGAGSGGEGGGDQGGADPEWLSLLSAEAGEGESASNLDWVKSKGFKTTDDIVKSLRGAERRISEGGGFKVPGEDATPEDIAAYHKAIGVPEDAKGYALPEPVDSEGNPIELNTAELQRATEAAAKHGVPKAAMDAVLKDLVEAQIADRDEMVKALQAKAGEHVKSWGDAKDDKLAQVNAAAKDAGLTRADMEFLRGMPSGPGKMLDMLAKMGSSFTEDTLVDGERKTFGMTAEQAQSEINAIKADQAVLDKALLPGTPENLRYNRALDALAAAASQKQ